MIVEILKENTDEIIAVLITMAYVGSWFIKPMPTEPLMIILGYYFGKKVT